MPLVAEKRPAYQAEQWQGLVSGLITGVQCDGDAADEANYFVETAAGRKRVIAGDWIIHRDGEYLVLSAKDFLDKYEPYTCHPPAPLLIPEPAAVSPA